MDIRTRQGLLNALVGKVGKRMDSLLVPLELLCSISRTEFSDMKAFLKWQKRQVMHEFFFAATLYVSKFSHCSPNPLFTQLNVLEEGLINHPAVGFGESGRRANDLRILLGKIEESEVLSVHDICMILHQILLVSY